MFVVNLVLSCVLVMHVSFGCVPCRGWLCDKLVLNSYINMWLKFWNIYMCFGKGWKCFYRTWLFYSSVSTVITCSGPLFIIKISKFGKTQNIKVLDWRVICAWAQTGGHSDIRVKSYDRFSNSARCWWIKGPDHFDSYLINQIVIWISCLGSAHLIQICSIKCGSGFEILPSDFSLQIWSIKCGSGFEILPSDFSLQIWSIKCGSGFEILPSDFSLQIW